MTLSRGSITNLLAPGLRKIYNDAAEMRKSEYTMRFNMLTSKRMYEEDSKFVGFGVTQSKPEGTNTLFDDPVQGGTKRTTHNSFGLGFRVTREAADDELYNQINKSPKALADSNGELIEQSGANLFINGFTTELGIDGEPLFDAAHPKLGGVGTYDNLDSTAFSITGLQTMTNYYESATNDRGLHMAMRPGMIVIPHQLRFTAREIFGTAKKPFTNDNEVNSILDEDLNWTVNHFLTSATNWFVLPKNKSGYPNFYWRVKPEYDADDHFESGDMLNKTYMRFSLSATESQTLYASNA